MDVNRNLKLVSAALFFWGIGEGIFQYFQPIYLQEWGASPAIIGSALGAVGFVMGIVHIPAGYLSDHFGARPVIWSAWVIGACSAAVMAMADSMEFFIGGLLLYGVTAFVMAPLNSYISSIRGDWTVGKALTTTSAAFSLGAVIGPLIGGTIGTQYGLRWVYLASFIFMLVSCIIIFQIGKTNILYNEPNKQPFSALVSNRMFMFLMPVFFLILFSTYLPLPLTPTFLQNFIKLDLSQIGVMGSIGSLGNGLITFFLGKFNPLTGILLGLMTASLSAILMQSGLQQVWIYGLGYFLLGGYRLVRSMVLALARPVLQTAEVGIAFGIIETVNSVVVFMAPIAAGLLFELNPVSIYTLTLGLSVVSLGIILVVFRKNIRNRIAE